MCDHVYRADYGNRAPGLGRRCPYPEFFLKLAQAGSPDEGGTGAAVLPIDEHGLCLFHSQELEWKRAHDLPGAFLRLVRLLDEHGPAWGYDFAEFVFTGSASRGEGGSAPPVLRIADTTFRKMAHFTAARFADEVVMERVAFPVGVELEGAEFAGDLTVTDASIRGAAMSEARFQRAWFIRVDFASFVLLDGARFTGTASGAQAVRFADTRFGDLASFAGAVFEPSDHSSAVFERVRFADFADFRETRFHCRAAFHSVTFAQVGDFIDTSFGLVGSSARYKGAAAEFFDIRVPAAGALTFRSSDPGRKLFTHDVEMIFVEEELAGTVYFENVNLAGFINGSRHDLLRLAREGKVQIGAGCIKYRLQTPTRTVPVAEGSASLVVDLCQTFAHYFTASSGLNLGVEIVTRERDRVSFFYYSDEDLSEAEFLERLARAEEGLWGLLAAGSPEQLPAIVGAGGAEATAQRESAIINAVDGLSALLGTFFRVGVRIAMGRWGEGDTRALLEAVRFGGGDAGPRAAALHRTLVARYTQSTLVGLNRLQNVRLLSGAAEPAAAEKVRILFLGANSMSRPLDLEMEVSRIERSLRGSREGGRLELRQVWAASVDSLMQAMLDELPAYVHFSGHGREAGIVLRGDAGEPRLVPGEALASLFQLFSGTVRCVVLNACFSATQGRAIRRHVPHVVGMNARIPDAAAVAFSAGFYAALGAGRDVPFAFGMGKARVHAEDPDAVDLVTLL